MYRRARKDVPVFFCASRVLFYISGLGIYIPGRGIYVSEPEI